MRCVLQTVSYASCKVDDKITGQIEKGYMILVGFKDGDNEEIIDKMVSKIKRLRIFEDENGKINLNIDAVNGSILSISQFTLYADTNKGNRPSFNTALAGDKSIILYKLFNDKLRENGLHVEEGIFGADMKISLCNEGPKTIILDSDLM